MKSNQGYNGYTKSHSQYHRDAHTALKGDNLAKADELALARFKIISPILSAMDEGADKDKIRLLRSEACHQAGIHRKTLSRWLDRYTQKGFDGLKFQGSSGGKPNRIIPDDVVKEAILLRLEVPSRGIPTIINILEMEGKVPKGFLKRSTLQERLREAGYSREQMKLYQKPGVAARRFVRSSRNDMWQADVKFFGRMRFGTGKGTESAEVFFIGFIDDATRYIVHGEFYVSRDQFAVEDCLRKAILKEGLPQRLFFDNGKEFRNKWMERACAILGIKLIFTAPYSPESKGKIERFNRTIESFMAEAALKNVQSLDEYNNLFNVWLTECYHNKEHSGLCKERLGLKADGGGLSPEIAYRSSKTPLRFEDADVVARAFLRLESRKVDKSGCISFKGKKYEVGVNYIGRMVDVVYDPADISMVWIEDDYTGVSFQVRELVIGTYTGPRPKLPQFATDQKPQTSRLLDEKQKLYDQRQLSSTRAISYAQINKNEGGGSNV
jgi:transposase InsO family protein